MAQYEKLFTTAIHVQTSYRHGHGVFERVGARRAGRLGVFPQYGVGHTWTLGLVLPPVTLSGLLLL